MTREKAAPECAGPDCIRDAIMSESRGAPPRWCIVCLPRPEPEPCDAVLKRTEAGKAINICGTTKDTLAAVMHWADGKRHVRRDTHRSREWFLKEFAYRKIGG